MSAADVLPPSWPPLHGLERLAELLRSRAPDLRARCGSELGGAASESPALDRVADWLYERWYSVPDPPVSEDAHPFRPDILTSAVRASLPNATRWKRGWVVARSLANGACVACRRGEARVLPPGDYANVSRPGMPVMPGDAVAVTMRVDRVDPTTGFWTTRSEAGEPRRPLVRLYWAARPPLVGPLTRRVVARLDRSRFRYSVKCPSSARACERVDPLVVYLERHAWPALEPSMLELARRSGAWLRRSIPPLTLGLAPGLAFAEDPGEEESFGQSRCRALAPAVLAWLEDPRDPALLESLCGHALRAAGIDPKRPWSCSTS